MQLLPEASPATPESVARVLTLIGPRLSKAVRRQVRPAAGLSMPQFIALRALGHGPQSAGALAQIFGVSRPTITRMVDGLIKKGLVERHHDVADRRVAMISLTATGRDLRASTEEAAERFLADLLRDLPPERLGRLGAAMLDLVALLDRAEAGSDAAPPADGRHPSTKPS